MLIIALSARLIAKVFVNYSYRINMPREQDIKKAILVFSVLEWNKRSFSSEGSLLLI